MRDERLQRLIREGTQRAAERLERLARGDPQAVREYDEIRYALADSVQRADEGQARACADPNQRYQRYKG